MHVFLWIGSALGAVLGLLHGVYLYRQQATTAGGKAMGLYYGVWTFALWTLFGSYVLALWILGLVAHTICRLVQRGRSA
jgi:hypothetical protein